MMIHVVTNCKTVSLWVKCNDDDTYTKKKLHRCVENSYTIFDSKLIRELLKEHLKKLETSLYGLSDNVTHFRLWESRNINVCRFVETVLRVLSAVTIHDNDSRNDSAYITRSLFTRVSVADKNLSICGRVDITSIFLNRKEPSHAPIKYAPHNADSHRVIPSHFTLSRNSFRENYRRFQWRSKAVRLYRRIFKVKQQLIRISCNRILASVTSMTLMAASWPVLVCRPCGAEKCIVIIVR